ncbi:epoxide hydrolase family protein [Sphingosinicella xenopeptidilytica]|uniref:Epoxide hydrolase family protein n=1 Tax=Sphingosinicella xenopeptidilytica TaxID=364098 RepID=A0ABW3C821_SPHXN
MAEKHGIPLVRPFEIRIADRQLIDLRARLAMARWPDEETVADWSQGVKRTKFRKLVDYWAGEYDWRRVERVLNTYPQFLTEIDGVDIHFFHIRSRHAHARPLLITHGWPGSVIEFLKIIEPLVDPVAHGGSSADAFHLILPTLPGFGFSGIPRDTGWNDKRIARAWLELMRRLGYNAFAAQGGDWGACVTTRLGQLEPPELKAIHLNWAFVLPDPVPTEGLSDEERQALGDLDHFLKSGNAYYLVQMTKPQTIGYSLVDSPVGLAAWIYEKYHGWTDNSDDPEDVLSRDGMLDNIMLYWLTATGASSARIYWEHSGNVFSAGKVNVPAAISVFPHEIYRLPESWTREAFPNLYRFVRHDRGGHFAAWERPDVFVADMRESFKSVDMGNL